jgi:hypothetical protein
LFDYFRALRPFLEAVFLAAAARFEAALAGRRAETLAFFDPLFLAAVLGADLPFEMDFPADFALVGFFPPIFADIGLAFLADAGFRATDPAAVTFAAGGVRNMFSARIRPMADVTSEISAMPSTVLRLPFPV